MRRFLPTRFASPVSFLATLLTVFLLGAGNTSAGNYFGLDELNMESNSAASITTTPVSHFQGFENTPDDNWNYSVYPLPYNSSQSNTVYGQHHVWARISEFYNVFASASGNYMYAMADLSGTGWHYIDFDPIPVNGIQNGNLAFKYITFNLSSLDEIEYSVAYDNFNSWPAYIPLSRNNQFWQTVNTSIPTGATHVRLRVRTKQINGVVCGGIDDVHLSGTIFDNPPTISTGTCGGSYCIGQSANISVPFSSTGNFNNGNTFIAQMSNAFGNFSNPISLGSISLSGTNPAGTISGILPLGLVPGTAYRVRVVSTAPNTIGTDNGLNISLSALSINLNSPTFSGGHNVSCPGSTDGQINLDIVQGQAGFQYHWSGPNGFLSSSEDLNGLGAGQYSVTVTDLLGCTASATIVLTAPTLSLQLSPSPITCFGMSDGAMSLTVSGSAGPFTYFWTGPAGFSSQLEDLINLPEGNYSVLVTDANGCTVTGSALLTDPDPLQISIQCNLNACGFHLTCANGNDGHIDLTVTGGTANYSYSWSGPGGATANSQDLQNGTSGAWTVTVTDQNGCQATAGLILTSPPPLSADIEAIRNGCAFEISCFGGNDGQASISNVNGGCPPYSYAWNDGGTGMTAGNLSSGLNSVTISDAQGCTLVKQIMLNAPDVIVLSGTLTPTSCESAADGGIDLTIAGGCPPYQFVWTGPNGFASVQEDLESLHFGTYQLNVTDASGCSSVALFDVELENDLFAHLDCCQDTVVTPGTAISIYATLGGSGPWEITYRINDDTLTAPSGASGVYQFMLSPEITTTLEILSIQNPETGCYGDACGQVTIAVNCDVDSFATGSGPVQTLTAGTCDGCDSENSVSFSECGNCINVSSCKDLSNVVIETCDGSHHKFDNLSGLSGIFCSPNGQPIKRVWVKSGCNFSGDGPGYGRRFELNCGCETGCDSTCGDLCVNTELISMSDAGSCRSVTLEMSCDDSCSMKNALKNGELGEDSTTFVDISIACGTISSFSNSLGLPMEAIYNDSLTGITGLRVHGLPNSCSSTGLVPDFRVSYELCDISCISSQCMPLVAYHRGSCIQYEMAVAPGLPSSNERNDSGPAGSITIGPNPVSNLTRIEFMMRYDTDVEVAVYNLMGHKKAVLFEGELKAYEKRAAKLRVAEMPAGIYLVRMLADGQTTLVKRMVVLK